jgi:undecaprenol kinase
MKNRPFLERFQFACNGIKSAFRSEASFRFQTLAAVLAYSFLGVSKAPAIWWALFSLVIAGVLACELINTAIEHLMDHFHPQYHEAICVAKDCLAGAVLVFSIAALLVLVCFLIA